MFSPLKLMLTFVFGTRMQRMTPDNVAVMFDRVRRSNVLRALCFLVFRLERLRVRLFPRKAVLFPGQFYYNNWYLSRALRKMGWQANVLNWDQNEKSQIYYHGEDFKFSSEGGEWLANQLRFYFESLTRYDVFHFGNAWGMCFGFHLQSFFENVLFKYSELEILKILGKKIVYSNNGCLDGVSQTSFRRWGEKPVCDSCVWRNRPDVCSDERNLTWGRIRNHFADFQINLGGNRADYNDDPSVHEVPEFFCLDPDFWRPDIEIPENFRLPAAGPKVRLYHAVGNLNARTGDDGVNIKSTHIYLPLIDRLQREGYALELLSYTDVPNKQIRFYQAQADIFLDMLEFGWFGAGAREALMLGKPVICHLRPEWLRSMQDEVPDYVAELPVINATPDTVYDVLKRLLDDEALRREVGERSRAFAVKWHSADAGARKMSRVYEKLLRTPADALSPEAHAQFWVASEH